MEQQWTKVSGSPMTIITDPEEMGTLGTLNYPIGGQNYYMDNLNQSQLMFAEDELSQFFVPDPIPDEGRETVNTADPLVGNSSSSQEQILSQGQLTDAELKEFMTTDLSFGDFDEEVQTAPDSLLQDLNIAQNIQIIMEPGTSRQQNKVLVTKTRLNVPRPLLSEIPETVNWPGDLNFVVKPLNGGSSKRCIYWPEMNKIYVLRDYHIPFKFQMNFESNECVENFTIATTLVYTEAQYKDIPVLRCLLCKEKEKTSPHPERIMHIVRCQHKSAQYSQDITERCSVACQVQLPQPGVEYFTREYMFTCMSSCKSGEAGHDGGMQRRLADIVFTLLDEEQKVRGRASFQVRICSAPLRDYTKDKSDADALKLNNKAKKRKSRSGGTGSNVAPKQTKTSDYVVGNKEDDDLKMASSSQETTYSDEETENKIKLRSLMKKAKWALSYKYSDNPLLRAKAKEVFCSIKMTNTLLENMKMMTEQFQKEAPNGSPDQGYQEERD